MKTNCKKLIGGLLVVMICGASVRAESATTSAMSAALSTNGGGGTNAGGQSVQAEEFSGAATYSVPLPVPPARGGIEPQLALNYNSLRKNPNSWVGYGWELDLGAIERVPEPCTGSFSNCNIIDYYEGTHFQARFSGQTESLNLIDEGVDPATYGLSVAAGVRVDFYQAKIESAFNYYLHLVDASDSNDLEDEGWIVIDKNGRTYEFGQTTYGREETYRCSVNSDPDTCTTQHWVARWLLGEVTDANGNSIEISYGSDRLLDEINYQDITIIFNKVDEYLGWWSYSYFPTFRQGFLDDYQMGNILESIEIEQNGSRLQKIEFDIHSLDRNRFPYLQSITQYGATDTVSLPSTTFEYYQMDDLGWDNSAQTMTASTSNAYGESTGFIGYYTQFADMNADGLPDMVTSYDDSPYIIVYYNNGEDFEYISGKSEWAEPYNFECESSGSGIYIPCYGRLNASWNQGHQWVFFMDINGDGLPDRIRGYVTGFDSDGGSADSTGSFYINFNTGNGWGSTNVWADPYVGKWAGMSDRNKTFMDMNGDGLIDRLVSTDCNGDCRSDDDYEDNGFLVYYNTGDGFAATPVFWADPIARGGLSDSAGSFNGGSGNKILVTIRDFNGDGLPDRLWRSRIYENGTYRGFGFGIALNRNGLEWAQPSEDTTGTYDWIIDGIDNLGMLDPMENEDDEGYISDTDFDLIDMNGDGYLDRIDGDTDNDVFYVHYFQGMTNDSEIGEFYSVADEFDDPAIDVDGDDEWDAEGYVLRGDRGESSGNPNYYAMIQDVTGDGYPDRVTVNPRNNDDNTKYYYVYPMRVNDIEFSDVSSTKTFTQPVGALKSVDDGQGNEMAIEYLPSSVPLRFSSAYSDLPVNHRFLPFNLYLAHKIYTLDYTMPSTGSLPEEDRWPGMRWTTFNYWGGNLFVRYADNPENTSSGNGYFSQFNGFQTVEKEIYRPSGETWDDITTTTVYHQAEGDVDTVPSSDSSLFLGAAYGHFALSGKPYSSEIATSTETLVAETNDWEVNAATASDNFNCSGDTCFPYLQQRTKTATESGSATLRVSSVTYAYDSTTGNMTSETYYDGSGLELLTKTTSYYASADFDPAFHLRDRPSMQEQTQGGTVYRHKEFTYDTLGNPTGENFLVDSTGATVSIVRTFNSDGTLQTITDIDGVTKTIGYDSDFLFPTAESVTLPTGTVLTTNRSFERMNGKLSSERNASDVGKANTYDDFGRIEEEYIVSSTGALQLDKEYSYQYVTATVDNLAGVTLLKTQVWVPQSNYADTSTNPAMITYADGSGAVLQKCTYTERGNYRLVQSRQSNGGRMEEMTEPVFSSSCNFLPTISSSVRTYVTEKDYQGRPTYIEPPPGDANSPMGNLTIAYAVNVDSELVKTTTTSDGRSKQEVFDSNERLVKVIDPLGAELNYQYNSVGDLEVVLQGTTALTTIHYDLLGRKDYMTDANMGTWDYDYNAEGFLEKQTDNAGQYVHQDYDTSGRITLNQIYSASGALEKYEVYSYDSGDGSHDVEPGELFQVEEFNASGTSLRWTKYGYDTTYRRINTITRNIPEVGELEQTVSNDFRGMVQSANYPGGESLYYSYDRIGNLYQLCSNSSCDSSTGEVYYSVDPSTAYDVYGGLQREMFGNGVTSDYSYYSNSHRLNQKTISNGSNVYSQRSYEYDIYANLMAISDPLSQSGSGALTGLSYDSLNRLTGYQQASASTSVSLTYSANGNIETNSKYSSSTYQYTSSRPHAVTQIGTETFGYDNNGNMTSDPNRTMVYNAQNQLTQVTMRNGQVVTYDYDYTGSRTEKHSTREDYYHATQASTTYYLGDAMEIKDGKLIFNIHVKDQRIATKSLGNITDILASSGATLRNIGIKPTIGLPFLMSYLLMFFALFVIASFRPILLSSRVRLHNSPWPPLILRGGILGTPPLKIRGGWEGLLKGWSVYTRSLHDALHQLPRRFAFKAVALTLIFISFAHFPLHSALAGDTGTPPGPASDENYFYYSHGDHLGSNHILTEGNSSGGIHSGILYNRGTLLQRIEFAPFGQETFVLNPNLQFDPRYTDQTYDVETGLYYYKARYYNPLIGRFIQPDTLIPAAKNLQAYNRYSYVMNNPLKYTDPSGHGFWSWFKKLFAVFIGALIGAFITVISMGTLGPIMAAALGGLIGGAIGGGIAGGIRGALMGALFGALGGAVFGGVGQGLAAVGVGKMGTMAIMGTVGAGLSYATGGWKGLITFGVGFLGALAGAGLAGAGRSSNKNGSGDQQNENNITKKELQDAVDQLKNTHLEDPKMEQLRIDTVNKLQEMINNNDILIKPLGENVAARHNPWTGKISVDPSKVGLYELPGTLAHEGAHVVLGPGLSGIQEHVIVYQFEYLINSALGVPNYDQFPTKQWIIDTNRHP